MGVASYNAVTCFDNVHIEIPEADLSIIKTDSAVVAVQGAPITYTITASNDGSVDVPTALIEDVFPDQLENISWTAVAYGGAIANLSGTGSLNETVNMPVGSTIVYTVTGNVTADARDNFTNTAKIIHLYTDATPVNNRSVDSDVIVLAAEGERASSARDKHLQGPI
ncbi:MAG: hypothetical protein R3C11_00240 [Planctomycetaceae bacterium]